MADVIRFHSHEDARQVHGHNVWHHVVDVRASCLLLLCPRQRSFPRLLALGHGSAGPSLVSSVCPMHRKAVQLGVCAEGHPAKERLRPGLRAWGGKVREDQWVRGQAVG